MAKKFLKQISKSYENILDNYFPVLKRYFAPWRTMDKKSNRVFILKGNLDLATLDLSISLDSGFRKQGSIDFTFNASKPDVFVEREGQKIQLPIKSFTNNYDKFYYNVNEMYEGFDCSREIAIDMVKVGIKTIFESDVLLFEEPPYMQLAYVEESLKYLPIGLRDSKTGRTRQFSLANDDVDHLLNFFLNTPNLEQYKAKEHSFNALITGGILAGLKDLEIDFCLILPPKRSRLVNGTSGHISDIYTIDSIKEWATNYFIVKQNLYRQFIDKFFQNIKTFIPEYVSGPYRYNVTLYGVDIIQNKFIDNSSISVYPTPVEIDLVEVDIRVVTGSEDNSKYEERLRIVNDEYKRLGRQNGYYTESNSNLWHKIRESSNIRKEIYNKTMKNLTSILDGK